MATINYLTTVQFDYGSVQLAGPECRRLGITRPLVVTDPGIRTTGLLDRLLQNLDGLAHAVYDCTPPNPTEAAAFEALERYRAHGATGLIAIGGGSSIDLAKAVALLATHAGPLRHYAAVEGGSAHITSAVA